MTIVLILSTGNEVRAQNDPMLYKRWNVLDINKIATTFSNTGLLCDGNNQNYNLARIPSFEYPQGSGINYGTSVAVVVGAPAGQDATAVGGTNPDGLAYLDATIDEGGADFWNEEHFAPYIEFTNATSASISTDRSSWPASWPTQLPNYYSDGISGENIENNALPRVPVLFDSVTGWPGFGKDGKQLADQETFNVMYGWGGTDQIGSGNAKTRWLRTQLIMRGMAWKGTLYEDFIVWVYIVRNVSPAPITELSMGVHVDMSFLPAFLPGIGFDADRHYYDPKLQLAYGWDDDGFEENPITGGAMNSEQISWGGVVVLQMPGETGMVETYDAAHFWEGQTSNIGSGGDPEMYYKWNLRNENDPHDSNKDGIDDDFDLNGIPDAEEGGQGYYIGSGADGLQIVGSGKVDLQPGEMDTLIFATVFGNNEADLKTNASRAITLYNNDWTVVKAPPEPTVEVFKDNRKVILVWGTESEQDNQFEGYKIYRSLDNGQTWGAESYNDFEGGVHYIPLAQFDKVNGIKGFYETLPEFAWFDLGTDSWLTQRYVVENATIQGFDLGQQLSSFADGDSVNVYVDRSVVNGLEYMYYIAAYDSGNGITGPLENSVNSKPGELNNTVSVRPSLAIATNALDGLRVVPNPYKVSEIWEKGFSSHKIQFTGLPSQATIQIFNSAGERIKTIRHERQSSIAEWDLKNEFDQLIAPGVYFYHIKTPLGNKKGKMILIL